jgi:hypothetical protein
MRSVRLDPDHDAVMRIGGKAPGGGPILSVGIDAMSATGSRHSDRQSALGAERQRGRQIGNKMIVPEPFRLPNAK